MLERNSETDPEGFAFYTDCHDARARARIVSGAHDGAGVFLAGEASFLESL